MQSKLDDELVIKQEKGVASYFQFHYLETLKTADNKAICNFIDIYTYKNCNEFIKKFYMNFINLLH